MNQRDAHPRQIRLTTWVGGICGMLSAVIYTLANGFLRSVTDQDPAWVSFVKASWIVLVFGPWLIWLMGIRQRVFPDSRTMLGLILASILGQLGGNLAFQWSLGVIGLALSVPLTIGAMLVSGGVLGWITLGERIRGPVAVALGLIIAAIMILSLGAEDAFHSIQSASETLTPSQLTWKVLCGALAACLSGVAYAVMGISIRQCMLKGSSVATPMVVVGLVGMISLGLIAVQQIGLEGMLATDQRDLTMMCLAGLANAVAFLALTKSLHLLSVVYVNAINASQVAMAAVAGVWFFGEAMSQNLIWGTLLTMLGFGLLGWKRQATLGSLRPGRSRVVQRPSEFLTDREVANSANCSSSCSSSD